MAILVNENSGSGFYLEFGNIREWKVGARLKTRENWARQLQNAIKFQRRGTCKNVVERSGAQYLVISGNRKRAHSSKIARQKRAAGFKMWSKVEVPGIS